MPQLSVCIPAFNRPQELSEVLESVAVQEPGDWEVVVVEDCSPRRVEIGAVVNTFSRMHPSIPVRYFSNPTNLGFDGNLRAILDRAEGDYCLFMGDDDILCHGALQRMSQALARPNIGVVLRAWQNVDKDTGNVIEDHRYFPGDRVFPAGPETVAAFYRRSVSISGLTIHRQAAQRLHTDRFDGTLLYQLYLVGRLLLTMDGYYISCVQVLRRCGGAHFFGSSETEKETFKPGELLPAHSVAFIRGLITIAEYLDREVKAGLRDLILRDVASYSYPMLAIQAERTRAPEFRRYSRDLAELGLGGYPLFWMYYYALRAFGPERCGKMIRRAKRIFGRTPVLAGSTGAPS